MEKHHPPDALDRALTDLLKTELPKDYRSGWRAAIQREEQHRMKAKSKAKAIWRVALPVAAALVLVVGALSAGNLFPSVVTDTLYSDTMMGFQPSNGDAAAGPSGSNAPTSLAPAASKATATYASRAADTVTESAADAAFGTADTGADNSAAADAEAVSGQKIVRTADLTIASTAFDADTEALTQLTETLGGYISSINVSGEASQRKDRVAYYNLRIPSDKLDEFLTGMAGIGHITSRYETATDMTTQYSDTQMRLSTQQTKMERLTELLKQASDVSDLLEIESEIADTQYTIDQLESSLRTIDRNVDRSDVSVTLREQSAEETAQTVELTLWQRIGSGFVASVTGLAAFGQNLLVFLAMLLPVLVPLAALGVIVWLILRARRRGKAERAGNPPGAGTSSGATGPVSPAVTDGKPRQAANPAASSAAPAPASSASAPVSGADDADETDDDLPNDPD